MVKIVCGAMLLVALVVPLRAQQPADALPRRGWFGVALGPHEAGALVTAVVPGSPAAVDGIKADDVIRSVDGSPVRTPADVIGLVARHAPASTASFELLRAGQELRRSVTLSALPKETLPGVSFEYGSVPVSDGTRLRTIVSVPDRAQQRLPAVMLLGGGGCGSIDVPMAPDSGPAGNIRAVAVQGYVTMRVEKSGVGDSQGPPCEAIGYQQELEGYQATLAALRRHPRVDPDRIALLGISLGGVFAPVLAAQTSVRGIVVFGTPAGPPSPYPGRSERFFKEFAGVDVAAAWSAIDAPVLVLQGEFDENTFANEHSNDHARIAALVNAKHPGRAAARVLPRLDHCATQHATMDEARGHCGAGRPVPALNDAILAFLRDTL